MKTYLYASIVALIAAVSAGPLFAKQASKEQAACITAYHMVHAALAADDLAGAKEASNELAKKARAAKSASLVEHALGLYESGTLEAAREHFKAVSKECIAMAEGVEGEHVFNCPMVKADWLQTGVKALNPYMGKKMPNCGAMKPMKGVKGASTRPGGCCAMAS